MSADRPRGRPSVASERADAIIGAYVDLVVETSDPGVSVRQIAERAGVARTAVAHFVGSREELVADAIRELARRYEVQIRAAAGDEPSIGGLLDALFDDRWVEERSVDDQAFDILGQLVDAHPIARAAVRDAYTLLVDELTAAIGRHAPDVDADRARGAAYAITCLAEFHPFLRQVDVDPGRADAPRAAAESIVASIR